MKINDIYNYDNPLYAGLRDPARGVVAAYQTAARFFDTIQEYVYIEEGLIHCARIIHEQAHTFPKLFDKFGDILHEQHLMIEYPATPEMDWKSELIDMDSVFEVILQVLDNIQSALSKFHATAESPVYIDGEPQDCKPMAIAVEDLMINNSKSRIKFLNMWKMWDNNPSHVSFDSWCEELGGID